MGRFKFRRGLGVSMDALRKLFDLSGRVALITGGSRGLGLQIAEALGEFGATLVLTARKQDELDAAVGHLSGHGIAASALAVDLSKVDASARGGHGAPRPARHSGE